MDVLTERSEPLTKPEAELRDFLAEERTFLAWIRTGIALMGLGLLVARFGIFGDGASATQHGYAIEPRVLSLWLGVVLIAVGVIVNLVSAWRFKRLVGELNRSRFVQRPGSTQGLIVAAVLALLGIAITVCMIPALA